MVTGIACWQGVQTLAEAASKCQRAEAKNMGVESPALPLEAGRVKA